jgi:hypothetical protein
MAKYTITNQKELRRSFWEFCKEFGGEFEREANKKKHSFKLDFNIAFGEYKDGLCKEALYRKVYTNVQHFINNKLCFV